jgi:glycosyltransferase involved in cell wall biosynthesis
MDFALLQPEEPRERVAARHEMQLSGKSVIGTSAHLRAWKRTELLIQACAGLPRDHFQLLIVGDGPDRARLEQITKGLGLESDTVFAGMQKHVGDYLAVMDVFVLPSGPQESFGNSAVEAMAVGLPTIVFRDGGGLIEHIEDGQTGFLVGSANELTDRLRSLLADPNLRKEIGLKAARHVRETYTLEAMVRRYDAIYSRALGWTRELCGD